MKLILIAVLMPLASLLIIGRDGFDFDEREWASVIGKSVEEAQEIIRHDLPDVSFVVVSEEMYNHTPSEGYLNRVIMGVNESNIVVATAKYNGYVPDLEFAKTLVGKTYAEAEQAIKIRLPSCKIVVVRNGETIHSCCGSEFYDHLKLEVDSHDRLTKLPVFVPFVMGK